MTETVDILSVVGQCQVEQMQNAAYQKEPAPCGEFYQHVRNVQAAIISTYQVVAYSALRQDDPAEAAKMWKRVKDLCDSALNALRALKVQYPDCGTSELYDLALDYRAEAEKRYLQNLQDSECAKTPPPKGLFPSLN